MRSQIGRKIVFMLVVAWIIVAMQSSYVSTFLGARAVQQIPDEIRGIWITNVGSGVLFVPWGVRRALHTLADLNFNTVYPVVWNHGYTFYPSAIAEEVTGSSQAPLFSLMHLGTDVLQEMIHVGHQRRLRIIPWFEYGFMVPRQSQLASRHPDWLSKNVEGSPGVSPDWSAILRRDKQAIRDWTEGQNFWLNPFHPEVQEFILQMLVELISNYGVEGIQLDDHFGLPIDMGYDPVTVQQYQNSHQGKSPPNDPSNPEWVRWRAEKISAFMGTLVKTVKSIQPDFVISLSPNPQPFAYRYYLQDWESWIQQGWIDELVLQVYRSDLNQIQDEISRPSVQTARQDIPVAIALLSGTWRKPVEIAQLQEQINLIRQNDLNGVSFFYWESLVGYLAPESPYRRQQFLKQMFTSS